MHVQKHDSTMDNIDCVTYIIYDSTRQMVAENMPVQYVYDKQNNIIDACGLIPYHSISQQYLLCCIRRGTPQCSRCSECCTAVLVEWSYFQYPGASAHLERC